ncbi:MAG TPA: tetratricopeptide repeat protein, partial [Casimicrobiaceae bacterium]|nr:tetratricopeptide repeat protein [Casimicrobiaceae bacterium]
MLKSLFSRRAAIDVEQAVRQAREFHGAGRPSDAQPLCEAALKAQPGHFEALHLLGVIKLQQGKYGEAEALFAQAILANADSESAHTNRGSALLGLGRPDDALESFGRALSINPESADACVNRAAALLSLGRQEDAIASYDRALAIRPDFVIALSGRANALNALGRLEAAVAAYGTALAVRPDDVALLNDRANALHHLGRHAESLAGAQRALALDPQSIAAFVSLGNALHALGRSEEALSAYDRAIELAPDFAGGPFNRGIVLHALGRLDEAIAAYSWACAIDPKFTQALFNCAVAQSQAGRHEDAMASYRQILELDPDYPHAAGNVVHEQAQMCSWAGREALVARVIDDVGAGKPVVVPHPFLAMCSSAKAQLACARALVALHHPPDRKPRWTGEIYRHDKIRIAYVSADFHEHAVAFLIAGMLERHDHDRFDITGIVFGLEHESPMRSRIEATFDRVIDVRKMRDGEVADLMRNLEIDIAVDLMGYTKFSRTNLFACRPAPVQVNFLGFPATMGAPYMDYIIADRNVIPEAMEQHYAEKVVLLPDSLQVNDANRRIAGATPTRAEAGLPPEGFVFCSFNNSYKLNPEMFAIWMRLIDRVPGSVLWLVAGNPAVEANLRREAQDRGVDPARLVFARRLRYEEYLAQYRLADLFLDTLPYNGGVTISDALWAGLPVLSCSGDAFSARLGRSLLHAVGLPELVASSLQDYEARAFDLATHPAELSGLRQRLARNRDTFPLFDTDRFRRNIEAAYVTMWEKTQRG